MKRLFALAIAWLASLTTMALAGSTHTLNIGPCDITLTLSNDPTAGISRNYIAAFPHVDSICGQGFGFVGKIPVAKDRFEDDIILSNTGTAATAVNFIMTLSYPLPGVGKQGTVKTWQPSGSSLSLIYSGSYTEVN